MEAGQAGSNNQSWENIQEWIIQLRAIRRRKRMSFWLAFYFKSVIHHYDLWWDCMLYTGWDFKEHLRFHSPSHYHMWVLSLCLSFNYSLHLFFWSLLGRIFFSGRILILFVIKQLFKFIDKEVFLSFYKNLVRPMLEYGQVIWYPTLKRQKNIYWKK